MLRGRLNSLSALGDILTSRSLLCFQVERESVFWWTGVKSWKGMRPNKEEVDLGNLVKTTIWHDPLSPPHPKSSSPVIETSPAPSGQKIPLYSVAHSRVT